MRRQHLTITALLLGGSLVIANVSALAAMNTPSSTSAAGTVAAATTTSANHKQSLFDMPISNNGARCRIILYKKGIPESEVKVVPPSEVGGLTSETYCTINPLQKMPALSCSQTGLKLYESDTICRYLLTKYANEGPSFQLDNPKSNLIARIHDMYMTTIQTCMYRPPPFGPFGTRKEAIAEYQRQMKVIDDLIDPSEGMYLCGAEVSLADATVFPSMVFANHILPKFDIDPPLPTKLATWFNSLKENDPAFRKVYDEMMSGLQVWEERKRWDNILGAGWRDEAPRTIFDKIIAGDIPADKVMETDKILAFKDIHPAAPAHVLVIPKDRNALTRISRASEEHVEILGRLMVAAGQIAKDKSLGFGDGARIVVNDGPDGGQEVMHLHVHVLGGRQMHWPAG